MSENSIGNMRTMSPAPDGKSSLGRADRYSLQERIGQGGFGSVWKAVDNETGVAVAVKALHPLIAANRDELERVRQNFVLVSRLTHPGICVLRHLHKIERIDDQAQSNLRVGQGDYLVVMDLVDGVTLTQYRLARGGTLPLYEALDLGGKIADALDYAHRQRIVHRDIKPSNIMITQNLDGTRAVKILDFGLAAEIRNSLSRVSRDLGDTTGTRPYMAPEQWSGKRQNAKSDQYSMAVVLYELLSGWVPFASAFESGDPVVMMNVVRDEAPEPLDECDRTQNAAMLRGLAKDKKDRWSDCKELVHALQRCHGAPHARPNERTPVVPDRAVSPSTSPVLPHPEEHGAETSADSAGPSIPPKQASVTIRPIDIRSFIAVVIVCPIIEAGIYGTSAHSEILQSVLIGGSIGAVFVVHNLARRANSLASAWAWWTVAASCAVGLLIGTIGAISRSDNTFGFFLALPLITSVQTILACDRKRVGVALVPLAFVTAIAPLFWSALIFGNSFAPESMFPAALFMGLGALLSDFVFFGVLRKRLARSA